MSEKELEDIQQEQYSKDFFEKYKNLVINQINQAVAESIVGSGIAIYHSSRWKKFIGLLTDKFTAAPWGLDTNQINQTVAESILDSEIEVDKDSRRDKFIFLLINSLNALFTPKLFPTDFDLNSVELLEPEPQEEDDEISKLIIQIDENLQAIAESQIRTAKDREEISRLDEEINSLLEAV